MFTMFSSLKFESEAMTVDLPMVCEFPYDISDLPPEREVEFTVDLVLGIRPVLMKSYKMCASLLSELKKTLEELIKKKFFRTSASLWGAPVFLVKKKYGRMKLYVDY